MGIGETFSPIWFFCSRHCTPPTPAGSTLRNANLLCALSNVAGFVFVILAFTASRSFGAFMGLFAAGQLLIFLLQVRGLGRGRGRAGLTAAWEAGQGQKSMHPGRSSQATLP